MFHRVAYRRSAFGLALLFATPTALLAQQTRSGGTGFGQTGSALGQSSFGQGTFGQSGFGQSSFGQGSFGQGSFGQGGIGAGVTLRTGENAFIGRDIADIVEFYQARGRQTPPQTRPTGRQSRQGSEVNTADIISPPVLVKLRMSEALRRERDTVIASINPAPARSARIFSERGLDGVATTFEGGVARLEGSVASEDERRLAEAILRIEPGVLRVENLLRVDSTERLPAP